MSFLTLRNISYHFPSGATAVKDLTFSLEKGEFVVLAGENGSGKTVLAKICVGLKTPTEGKIFLEGEEIGRRNRGRLRRKIGLVFQNPLHQFVGQTVEEDVAFGPENLGLSREAADKRVNNALRVTGLTAFAERSPHELSGGEQRRLALAGVLAMGPECIILDEPFTGLDFHGTQELLRHIVNLHTLGHAVVLISHDMEKMLAHATRLTVLHQGRKVLDGLPQDVYPSVGRYGLRCVDSDPTTVREMTWLNGG